VTTIGLNGLVFPHEREKGPGAERQFIHAFGGSLVEPKNHRTDDFPVLVEKNGAVAEAGYGHSLHSLHKFGVFFRHLVANLAKAGPIKLGVLFGIIWHRRIIRGVILLLFHG